MLIFSTLSFGAAPDRVTGPIISGQTVELARSLHPRVQSKYDQGAIDAQTMFSYVTLLTSPSASQQRALDQLTADQQNPSSPNYHKWLTPAQYADRFGLSQNDVNQITAWLKAQGFTVVSVGGGRNSIVFSGTARQIEAAFQTSIHHYRIGGEEHFANATPVKIPAAFSGVVTGVRGLNSFRLKPANIKKRLHRDYYSSSLKEDFVAPGDIAIFYDINKLYSASPQIDGSGQQIAIIGQTDIYMADINDFRSGFNLTPIPTTGNNSCKLNANLVVTSCNNATNFGYVLVGGTEPGTPNLCGDITEADLDLEWSGATARNAQIIYVNAPATFDSNCNFVAGSLSVEDALAYAIAPPNNAPPVAPIISMSYGACELNANLSDESEFRQATSEGVTILMSSGDDGATQCDPNRSDPYGILATGGAAVTYPASSVYVTGVGGTAIPFTDFTSTYWGTSNGTDGASMLPPPAPRAPEEAWNDDFEFAAYCSADFATSNFCQFYNFLANTTASQVQQTLGQAAANNGVGDGISAAGGGASNCATFNGSGQCTGGFPQPSWQKAVPGAPAGVRYVPDVSLLASPNFPGYVWCTPVEYLSSVSPYDTETTSSCANGIAASVSGIVQNNTFVVDPSIIGGTSASTPVFAGMVALLSQYLGATDGLGNINPTLYKLAATQPNNYFNQLTSGDTGNNEVYCIAGTPGIQTVIPGIICPGSGVLGFFASNVNTTTGYNLVTGLGSVDLYNLAVAWGAGRATSTVTVHPSASQIFLGQSVTLTATMSPLTATGEVSFFSSNGGTTGLGSATLSQGVASISTTALKVGTNNISASFPGDGYNLPSVGTTTVTVTAPDFTIPTPPGTPPAANPGQSTSTTMSIATVGGGTFPISVTYACSGLPTGATCSFNPTQIAATTGSPKTVTITVQTAGPFTGVATGDARRAGTRRAALGPKPRLWLPLSLPLAGMLLVGLVGRRLPRSHQVAALCVALALAGLLVACGGGSSSPPPVTVSVSPSTVNTLYPSSILAGEPAQTQQFSATVSNTTSQTVTWAAGGVTGGNSTVGTISATGLYTAPATLPSPAAVPITATSSAATSPGTATVNLQTPTPAGTSTVTVTITEGTVQHTTTFSLTVN